MSDGITLELNVSELRDLADIASSLGCDPRYVAEAIVCAALNEMVTEPHDGDCDRLRDMRGYIEGYTGAASGWTP